MANWEYCILLRVGTAIDTKWYVNRTFKHSEPGELPAEATEPYFAKLNGQFDKLHAKKVYPVLPAVMNLLGADGWDLIDDMDVGIPGDQGLVFKREVKAKAKAAKKKRK
ncbi:MAG: hypothetical protein HZB52_15770 [Chloroflexi bacterium]|nr:hypothetical protein [Chloroflexota bacterium]